MPLKKLPHYTVEDLFFIKVIGLIEVVAHVVPVCISLNAVDDVVEYPLFHLFDVRGVSLDIDNASVGV